MRRVIVVCEGPSEEQFVKRVVAPYLAEREVFVSPTIVSTRKAKGGRHFKGGLFSYDRPRNDIVTHLNQDRSATAVTSLFDYYALPADFPGRANPRGTDCYQRARYVERQFGADIGKCRFFPHVQLHEFEALLFSDPAAIARHFFTPGSDEFDKAESKLFAIRQSVKTPEEINDNYDTCPNRRIKAVIPGYGKKADGPAIAEAIGMEKILAECPHFKSWVDYLLVAHPCHGHQ